MKLLETMYMIRIRAENLQKEARSRINQGIYYCAFFNSKNLWTNQMNLLAMLSIEP